MTYSVLSLSRNLLKIEIPALCKNLQLNVGKNSLSVQSEIGSGALIGTVYKVCDNTSQRIYALKEVICADQNSIDAVMREAKTLAKTDHKRIVRIKGCDSYMLSNGDSLFLILTGVLFWRRLELSAKQTQHSRNKSKMDLPDFRSLKLLTFAEPTNCTPRSESRQRSVDRPAHRRLKARRFRSSTRIPCHEEQR